MWQFGRSAAKHEGSGLRWQFRSACARTGHQWNTHGERGTHNCEVSGKGRGAIAGRVVVLTSTPRMHNRAESRL